jgi:hypothetical protein
LLVALPGLHHEDWPSTPSWLFQQPLFFSPTLLSSTQLPSLILSFPEQLEVIKLNSSSSHVLAPKHFQHLGLLWVACSVKFCELWECGSLLGMEGSGHRPFNPCYWNTSHSGQL